MPSAEGLAALWARIKEHKVLQWALAYAGAALAIAHGEELVGSAFDWGDVAARIVIALLILGFPVAITFAWYQGHKGARRFSAAEVTIVSLLVLTGAVIFTVVLRAPEPTLAPTETGAGAGMHQPAETAKARSQTPEANKTISATSAPPREPSSAATPAKPRLAVMPFENLSSDPANAFFTDGMHEEILTTLANSTPGLEVISRITMDSYKGEKVTVEQLAKDLGCTYVLEGSVRREGDQVRLTLQLIDASADENIWAQNYDRRLVSAMTLQSEVASEVAGQLKVRLAGGPAVASAPTENPVAYDFYLKARLARQNLNGANPGSDWRNVETLLDQALAHDPDFVGALIERATVNLWLFMVSHEPSGKTLELARADLDKAKTLAPNSPAVLGGEALWAYANLELDKTVELIDKAERAGLSDPDLLIWKHAAIEQSGRHSEAKPIEEQLIALDPGNASLLSILLFGPLNAREPKEAMRILDLVLARQPDNSFFRSAREWVLFSFTGNWAVLEPSLARINPILQHPGPDVLSALVARSGDMPDNLILMRRYDQARAVIDASNQKVERVVLIDSFGMIGMGNKPLAQPRAWADLLLGDHRAAREDGQAVLDFVNGQKPTKWNAWFLKLMQADGNLFIGDHVQAIKDTREAIAVVKRSGYPLSIAAAKYLAARDFAWSGAQDDAVALLEDLSTSIPGLAPAAIARYPIFTVPLADNTRYRALKAKLEAQMAANAKLLEAAAP